MVFGPAVNEVRCCRKCMTPWRWKRGKNGAAGLRSADERVPANGPVQMHPVRHRLRFSSAQAGRHASELVSERLHNIDRKRLLLAQAAGFVCLKNRFQVENSSKPAWFTIACLFARNKRISDNKTHSHEIFKTMIQFPYHQDEKDNR